MQHSFSNGLKGSDTNNKIDSTQLFNNKNSLDEEINYPLYQKQLDLPTVGTFKVKSINVKINRSNSGDFGFVLRKCNIIRRYSSSYGLIKEKKNSALIVEPINMERESALLPGDVLLRVNDTDIVNLTKNEVIQKIKESGNEVVLSVEPCPECLEFSFRRFSNVYIKHVNIRKWLKEKRSFKDLYNDIYNKIINKQGEIHFEESLLDNVADVSFKINKTVWIDISEGFTKGHLVKNEQRGKCIVRLETENEMEVSEEDISLANPPDYFLEENLNHLPFTYICPVLYNLIQRYGANLIHTYVGKQIIYINPMTQLNCFTEKIMSLFKSGSEADLPPHIYSVSQNALFNLANSQKDQTICIIGRSGSGKSYVLQNILKYFVHIENNLHLTNQKIQASFGLLNAFTSTKTSMNTKSSRCGKHVYLNYYYKNHVLHLGGIKFKVFLFDKYRIVHRPEKEPAFNIFYTFLAGISKEERLKYDINFKETNNFMTPIQRNEERILAEKNWTKLLEACKIIGISEVEWGVICKLLAAIYHLGMTNVTYSSVNGVQQVDFTNPNAIATVAKLLKCTEDKLYGAIFNYKNNESNTFMEPGYVETDLLNGFVTGLYLKVVDIIVFLINRSLCFKEDRTLHTIHIIDTPGFQVPTNETGSIENYCDMLYNYSFETFLEVNYQQNFQKELESYKANDIHFEFVNEWSNPISVTRFLNCKNNNQEMGLLNIIENEGMMGNQASLNENINSFMKNHKFNQKISVLKSFNAKTGEFEIIHCNNTQRMKYKISKWNKVCRNIPTIFSFQELVNLSNDDSLKSLVLKLQSTDMASFYPMKSTISQAQKELDDITNLISNGSSFFIYCLSPVPNSGLCELKDSIDQNVFDENIVHGSILSVPLLKIQLKTFSLVEYLNLLKYGYPESAEYKEFQSMIRNMIPGNWVDSGKSYDEILNYLQVNPKNYILGKNKIFFKSGTLFHFKNSKEFSSIQFIIRLQSHCRMFLAKKKLEKIKLKKDAIRIIQNNCGIYLRLKKWPWWKLYSNIKPLLGVVKTEEVINELKEKNVLLESQLKATIIENNNLKNDKQSLDQSNELIKAVNIDLRNDIENLSKKLEDNYKNENEYKKEIYDLKAKMKTDHNEVQDFGYSHEINQEYQDLIDLTERKNEETEKELIKIRNLYEKLKLEKEQPEDVSYLLDMLKEQAASYEAQMAHLKENFEEECQIRHQLQKERDDFINERTDLKGIIENLELQLKNMPKVLDEQDLDSLSMKQKFELHQRIRELEDEVDAANDNLDVANQEKLRLKVQIERINQERINELNDKEDEIDGIKSATSRKIKSLELQLEDDTSKYQALARSKRELAAANAQLTEQLEALRDNSLERKLRKEIKVKTDQFNKALSEIEALKAKKEDKSEIRELKNLIDELQNKLELSSKQMNYKELELDETKMELGRARHEKTELDIKYKNLRNELDQQQNDYEDLEVELDKANKKCRQIYQDNSDLINEKTALCDSIETLERNNKILNQKVGELESELNNRHSLKDDITEKNKLNNKIKELEMKLQMEESAKSRVAAASERFKAQNMELQAELESLKDKSDIDEGKNKKMQKQVKELKDNNEELMRSQETNKKQIQMLNNHIDDLEEELSLKNEKLGVLDVKNQRLQETLRKIDEEEDDDEEFDDSIYDDVINKADNLMKKRKFSLDQSLPTITENRRNSFAF